MGTRNRSLVISVIIDPPAAMPCALERYCPQRGIVFEIAQLVCEKLNFDCVFVPANTTLYGYSENGTWMGVVGDVAAGRVDTSLPRFTPTSQRAEVVDFSSSYFYEDMLLVTRRSEQGGDVEKLNLINAFGFAVWICIAVVVLLAGLTMTHTILFKRSISFIEHYVIKKLHADLLLTGKHGCIWTFSAAALILTRAYTGYIFTVRMAGETQKPFQDLRSFTDCVQAKSCKLVVSSGMLSYLYQLLDTDGETFTRLRTALRDNPPKDIPMEDLVNYIRSDKSSYSTALIWDTDIYFAANGYDPCDFYVIPSGLIPGPNTFPMPKNWTHRRELDKLGTEFTENGVISEIMSRYKVREIGQCQRELSAEAVGALNFLLNIFYFLLAGLGVSLLCFTVELTKPGWILRAPIAVALPTFALPRSEESADR